MVVCIPLVLRVRAVMGGWEYTCSVVSGLWVGVSVFVVRLFGCRRGSMEGRSGFSCVGKASVRSEACLGCVGRAHPLHCWMCSCLVPSLSDGRFDRWVVCFRLRRGSGGLKVSWGGGTCSPVLCVGEIG